MPKQEGGSEKNVKAVERAKEFVASLSPEKAERALKVIEEMVTLAGIRPIDRTKSIQDLRIELWKAFVEADMDREEATDFADSVFEELF